MFKISGEKFFIAAAFLGFAVFAFAYVMMSPPKRILDYGGDKQDKYFINENFRDDDPFITKNPGLEDMITGPIISYNDPAQGDIDSLVNLVYFSDFECQFCFNQEKVLKEIFGKYKGSVSVIWKDYPENKEDSVSFVTAVAARCAQMQGKFWQYHDLLFQNRDKFDENNLSEYAEIVGLDRGDFNKCLKERETSDLIKENIEEANALGIVGIPYLFVNKEEVMGEINQKELEQLIDLELKKTKSDAKEN